MKNIIHSQTAPRVLHPLFRHHRATDLAKAKRVLKWQRDPEGMRLRILEAAKQKFAAHGLAGARVDRIAAKGGDFPVAIDPEELYISIVTQSALD